MNTTHVPKKISQEIIVIVYSDSTTQDRWRHDREYQPLCSQYTAVSEMVAADDRSVDAGSIAEAVQMFSILQPT